MVPVVLDGSDFLVVNKPPGIPFHSEAGVTGIVELLKESYRNNEIFPVHRLDRVTSGAMLFAKSKQANQFLSGLFRERKITKTYLAISDRKPRKKQGRVIGDVGKARGGSYKLLRSTENPSVTRFRSKHFDFINEHFYAFELFPKTGKTHQLRVVMKALGSPIFGDGRYGASGSGRCYLHARQLKFEYEGQTFDIRADFRPFDELGLFQAAHRVLNPAS